MANKRKPADQTVLFPEQLKAAFRCKNCGRLHTSDDAAESQHPHSCRVCGAGVSFNPQGIKTIDSSNWERLAELPVEHLENLGINPEHVEDHKPWEPGSPPRDSRHIQVGAEDGLGTKDGVQ